MSSNRIGGMLLAGDIGGTKTLLGLFDSAPDRPVSIEVGEFTTLDYDDLVPMIREFLKARGVEARAITAASFGVAGAVTDQVARLTNVPWLVDAAAISQAGDLRQVTLLNDLEAMAFSVPVLEPKELGVLQHGVAQPAGNACVIAAGTGLGEALLHNIDGRFIPGASEGGHADWAARTPREVQMLSTLTSIYGRVSVEHIVSGPGLVNIYQFTHQAFGSKTLLWPSAYLPARTCSSVGTVADPVDLPAAISRSALERRCAPCVETLELFVGAYGAEAGNLALRSVATAGVYVGGGIAPKILPALQDGIFLDAFRSKDPMADFVTSFPVAVILNPEAGLLGAAVHANER
jgi:glucokinase